MHVSERAPTQVEDLVTIMNRDRHKIFACIRHRNYEAQVWHATRDPMRRREHQHVEQGDTQTGTQLDGEFLLHYCLRATPQPGSQQPGGLLLNSQELEYKHPQK